MVKKKVNRIGFNIIGIGKDQLIKQFLNIVNVKHALIIYEIISFNPVGSIINILASQFGLSKPIIMIILAFLL